MVIKREAYWSAIVWAKLSDIKKKKKKNRKTRQTTIFYIFTCLNLTILDYLDFLELIAYDVTFKHLSFKFTA